MALKQDLVRKLIKVTNDAKKQSAPLFSYGTVLNSANGKRYIKMDGSDNQVPIDITADVQTDDRVLVRVENHKATVIGNLTTPASGKTNNSYFRFIESANGDGTLFIGHLDASGEPDGTYISISPTDMKIVRGGATWANIGGSGSTFYVNGQEVANYGTDGVVLKQNGIEVARFGTSYADIRNGIRLIAPNGTTMDVMTIAYNDRSYNLSVGSSSMNELTIYGGNINLVSNMGISFMNASNPGLYNTLNIMTRNGPIDVVRYLDNQIASLQSDIDNISVPDTPTSVASIIKPADSSKTVSSSTHVEGASAYLDSGYYIFFGRVKFKEKTKTISQGVRRTSIAVSGVYDTWWQTVPAISDESYNTVVEAVVAKRITSNNTKVGVMAFQTSGTTIEVVMEFAALKVG